MVPYTHRERDILRSDLEENFANLVFRIKVKCAICRGKRLKSRLVAENGKNRDSTYAAISFCS